jgi:lipopolysaccharide export LptBFGC system permease protein LptF
LANFFLVIILDYRVSPHLVLYTPLLTALAGTLLLMPRKLRELLDVY